FLVIDHSEDDFAQKPHSASEIGVRSDFGSESMQLRRGEANTKTHELHVIRLPRPAATYEPPASEQRHSIPILVVDDHNGLGSGQWLDLSNLAHGPLNCRLRQVGPQFLAELPDERVILFRQSSGEEAERIAFVDEAFRIEMVHDLVGVPGAEGGIE